MMLPARRPRAEWADALRSALILLTQLSGTALDVDTTDETCIRIRFV